LIYTPEQYEHIQDVRRKAEAAEMTTNFFMQLIRMQMRRFTGDERRQVKKAYELSKSKMVLARRKLRGAELYHNIQAHNTERKNAKSGKSLT
jgi:hypothetical protein